MAAPDPRQLGLDIMSYSVYMARSSSQHVPEKSDEPSEESPCLALLARPWVASFRGSAQAGRRRQLAAICVAAALPGHCARCYGLLVLEAQDPTRRNHGKQTAP